MNNTTKWNNVMENSVNEGSYLMGTVAIILLLLACISTGFYFAVSAYA